MRRPRFWCWVVLWVVVAIMAVLIVFMQARLARLEQQLDPWLRPRHFKGD